ncbi:MAG: GAF domain-containing protein, partial [Anaerolineales bacterium]|nr:GAF domain-containing protein [Anaerolineales bacterium]MDW8447890.1 GAF domain-containing protein [Anaerolineales bacterium]
MDAPVPQQADSQGDPREERTRFLISRLAEIQALSLNQTDPSQKPNLLERIVQAAVELLEGDGACLYLAYPEQQELEVYIERNPTPFQYLGIRLAYGEGAAGWVAKEGKPLLVEDYATWPHRSSKFGPPYIYHSVISAPLIWDGHLEGVLQVFTIQSGKGFTQEDLDLLSLFANQASLVLQSAALLEKEHSQRLLAERLAAVTRALASTLNLETLLETILEQLAQALPCKRAAIFLLRGEVFTLAAQRGWGLDPAVASPSFSLSLPLVQEIVARQAAKVIGDVAREGCPPELLCGPETGAWMGVPLVAGGRVIGLIALQSDRPFGFAADHAAWASVFAQAAALAIANAGLYKEKEEQNQVLETLLQTGLSLTRNLDLTQVLSNILQSVYRFFGDLRNAYIFLYSPGNGEELRFGAQLWPEEGADPSSLKPRPDGLTAQVARSGEPIIVPEMEHHPLFRQMPGNWKGAILGLPLKIGDRVVGVMNVTFPRPRQFSATELSLLTWFGDQAAIAIENARLYRQVESERCKLGLIYAIGHQLNTSLEPDEILQRAIQLATSALDGHLGLAYRFLSDENTLSLRAVWGEFPTSIEEYNHTVRWDGGRGLIGWVMRNRQADLIPDVTQDERWWHLPVYDQGVRSAIAAPILFEDRLYGVLAILHTQPGAFDLPDLELVEAICQELSLALSHAERYQEAQHRLRQMTLLHELSQNFSRHLDLEKLLQTIVDELAANFHYPIIEIYLRNGDRLELRAYHGESVVIPQIPLDRGVIGRAVRTAQSQILLDVTQDPDYLPDNPQTVAEFVMPILLHGEVVGVINIETDRSVKLSQADIHFFQLLADQIGIALENATLYDNVRRYADELEEAVLRRTAELSELYQLSQEI